MGRIEYRVCDRCGEKINYHSRLLATVTYPKMVKIKWVVTGIISNQQVEMCGICAEELEGFMKKKPKL